MRRIIKNIIGYSVGILTFLFFIPFLLYKISKFFILPIADTIVLTLTSGIIFVCFGIFYMFWSNIYMQKQGKGNPLDVFGVCAAKTAEVITKGPYKYTRNPMLFGTFIFYLGLSFILNSITAVIFSFVFAILMVLYVKHFEEPRLYNDFKEKYIEYKQNTPLIIPKKPR